MVISRTISGNDYEVTIHAGGGREMAELARPSIRIDRFFPSPSHSLRLSPFLSLFLSRDSFNPYLQNGRPYELLFAMPQSSFGAV